MEKKTRNKKIIQIILAFILTTVVSYFLASVLIIGSVKTPINLGNDSYLKKTYTTKKIVNNSEYLEVTSDSQFKTQIDPFSRINIDYGNKRNDNKGYLLLDVGVLSEENIDVRVCIFRGDKVETLVQKINEGNNIFDIPLDNVKKIRVDFITTIPVEMVIDELTVTNQLVGVLPLSWYICFIICFLLIMEIICACLSIEIKVQKKIYSYVIKCGNKLKENGMKIWSFVGQHKWAFVICFVICIFAYAYNLMNFSLGVDEERDIVRSIGTLENVKKLLIQEGRYGLYWFRALETVDGSLTPFVGEIIAVISIFLNIVVGAKCFEIVTKGRIRNSAIVIFGGMMATLPFVNAEIMCYSIMNAGVYFSIMLTTMALMFIASFYESKKKSRLLVALILTVVAMLFAEAHNVWFITGTVLINLVWVIANKDKKWLDWIKYVLHYAGVFIVAFVIYMIIRTIVGQNGYAEGYIQWGKASASELIKGIFDWIGTTFTNKNLPGAIYFLVGIVIFIGFILINAIKEKGARAGLILLLSLCLLIAPFMLCFVAGNRMPYRTMEALILLEAGIWFVVVNFIDKKTITRYILLASATFIIWNQGVWMNRLFYGADVNAKLDMEMGYAIGEEIEKVAETTLVDKPVVIVGKVQHYSPNIYRIDAIGQSIFFRDKSQYKVYYLRHLGFTFQQASEEQIAEANELAVNMPVWPLSGSVQEFDDVIVVKLNQ